MARLLKCAGVMVKGVENNLRGFVPMSQLSYELSKVILGHIWKKRRAWQTEHPGDYRNLQFFLCLVVAVRARRAAMCTIRQYRHT
jgi:hypothetical protein